MASILEAKITSINHETLANNEAISIWAGDTLEGTVTVTSKPDFPAKIQARLKGKAVVSLSKSNHAPWMWPHATHEFLDISAHTESISTQDINSQPTRQVKFTLQIPHILKPESCIHTSSVSSSQRIHRQLPPSIGGKNHIVKDIAAKNLTISYYIQVTISSTNNQKGHSPKTETHLPLLFQPNLQSISIFNSRTIDLQGQAMVTKLHKYHHKTGTITATILPHDTTYMTPSTSTNEPTSLRLQILLQSTSTNPPPLKNIQTKLTARTLLTNSPRQHNAQDLPAQLDNARNSFSQVLSGSRFSLNTLRWEQNPGEDGSYTAQISVPVIFPAQGRIIPSYESCISSREYVVSVVFAFSKLGVSSFDMKVPVRVEACGMQVIST